MTRSLQFGAVILIAMELALAGAWADAVGEGKSFKGPAGLQLYSLRGMFKSKGVPATLDLVRKWGFKYVETGGTYGVTDAEFKAELQRRGLVWISSGFPYQRLRDDLDSVVREATLRGVVYVGCAYISHKPPFDEKQCREAATVFNRAGKALAEHGLHFYYHNHGYEFAHHGDGSLFDLIAAETDPRHVQFEVDVLCTFHPGQNPGQLIGKYASRVCMLHLKDLRKSVPTGLDAPKIALTDDVAVGTGQIDWQPLLRAAQKAGVKYYFIEDESPSVLEQVPQTLRFLQTVEF